MKKNFFINSPLEKGDTGGCFDKKASIPLKAEFYKGLFQKKLYENLVRTTPSAPFIKGEFFRNLSAFPCPAELMGNAQFAKELAILQRGRESLKKAILLFVHNSQLVATNLKKGA